MKAGLYGVQTSQAFRLDQATGDQKGNDNTVGISLSYGAQSSKTTQTREQTHASGSSLTAGNNLTVVATDGDVLVQGSSLAAENDMLIQASRDLNLISAQNTSRLDGKNESHGGSAGVGIGYGSGGVGINFSAGLNAGKGKEKGNSTTYTETTLNAGNGLVIASGRDTTLSGAQASGEHIVADVGRNLTLQSQQDTDSYNSTQKGISAGGNFSLGTMTGSGGISASRDKMDSDYTSVQEQTGIFAGDGGFDIRTGGHTQLDGAVIASTAAAENNRLDTGTLGWRDIRNHAEYSVEHQSAGFSSGGASIDGQFTGNMASNLLAGMNSHDSAEGTTRSAVAQGDIIIRDPASQTQDTARLSRDTANASDTVGVIFDKAREQRRLDEAQLISDTGSQMSDIARTEGQIAQQNAMKDPAALRAAEEQLRAGGNASPTPQEIADQAGRTAMAQYGTGSDIQRAIQAATAAVKGAAGGDLSAALAGAAAPYVAEVIGHRSGLEDGMKKAAAHAVANAALAALQGQSALAGAAGAVAEELAGSIAKEMYGKEVAELSESQKQTISSLATIAAGIAGGLAGDGTAAALAGAQSGKGVVENNSLSAVIQGGELAAHGCMKISACRDRLVGSGLGALLGVGASTSAMDALSNDEQMNLIYVASLNDPSLLSQLNDAQKAAYESLTGKTITSTDGTQVINPGPSNTGGDQTVTGNVPSNTGNNQPSGQGVTNTGNTDGNPDTGGNTTVTPIPEGPSKDGLAYLSGDNKYVPSPKHGAGGWGTPMDLSDSKAQEVLNNSIQGGKQRYGVADGKVYEFQPDNVGGWHGYPIPGNEAPPKVLRELLYRGDISKVEYNKMIKGKL